MVAKAIWLLNELLLVARKLKVTRSQYLMFLLADMMTWVEVAKATCLKASSEKREKADSGEFMLAVARLFSREAIEKVYINTLKILKAGQEAPDDLTEKLSSLALNKVFEGALADMDLVARELTK
jgi:alkylation response protein AidB-like acyl-CoA dehydrogenase